MGNNPLLAQKLDYLLFKFTWWVFIHFKAIIDYLDWYWLILLGLIIGLSYLKRSLGLLAYLFIIFFGIFTFIAWKGSWHSSTPEAVRGFWHYTLWRATYVLLAIPLPPVLIHLLRPVGERISDQAFGPKIRF
jgi:hypothetical protein